MGTGGIWEISVLSAQFCCEPKTALKNKVCFENSVSTKCCGGLRALRTLRDIVVVICCF